MPGLEVAGVDCVGSVLFGRPDAPPRLQSGLGIPAPGRHPFDLPFGLADPVTGVGGLIYRTTWRRRSDSAARAERPGPLSRAWARFNGQGPIQPS
ncbi:hypothetical protein GCM10009863_33960 [Streptomyces axinellae]|uniref:Uncharacterized protein n=1 Tax=Streptomyces axinellae TaxID=552788 RepID=A0ABN3Q5C5_9ACTN